MMNWHEYLTTLRRTTDNKILRVAVCSLVLASSVAIVAVCIWDGFLSAPKNPNHSTIVSRKPTGPILASHSESISFDDSRESHVGVSFSHEDSRDVVLPLDQDELTSIAIAGRMCFPPAVSIALQQMIDEPVNDRRDTILHVACQAGDLVTICFLIDAGADLTVTNRFGETPLDLVDYTKREYFEGITRMIGDRRSQSPDCSDSAIQTHHG